MSDPRRIQAIKAILSDFLYFQVKTGVDRAAFYTSVLTDAGAAPVAIDYEDGQFTVKDGDDTWSLPAALLEPDVPDAQSGDSVAAEAATEAPVTYTVANTQGQEGSGRWESITRLIRELYPLRADLSVVAIEPDGTRRGIDQGEAIEMALVIQQLERLSPPPAPAPAVHQDRASEVGGYDG